LPTWGTITMHLTSFTCVKMGQRAVEWQVVV
jgi:hypothetical protein